MLMRFESVVPECKAQMLIIPCNREGVNVVEF